nr:MAG TPA: hypothetical protein [Caudoviricetes sp.]
MVALAYSFFTNLISAHYTVFALIFNFVILFYL